MASTKTALGEHLEWICWTLRDHFPKGTTFHLCVFAILMPQEVPKEYPPLGPPCNWLVLQIIAPCGALEAIKRLRAFEENQLWSLYDLQGKDFNYLLQLDLPDDTDSLIHLRMAVASALPSFW